MEPNVFHVERVDVETRHGFAHVVAALERRVPVGDAVTLGELARSRVSAAQIETAVQAMVGDLGLMILAKLEQGALVSLLGKPKKLSTYLIGNPVLANRMFERNPAVGGYAPLRATVYEDYAGNTHFTYERPSTSLSQFDDAEIRAVARVLDEKMARLTAYLAE
jgi:uncharacterized protein (DUF302 family)